MTAIRTNTDEAMTRALVVKTADRLASKSSEYLGAMLAHCTKGDAVYETVLLAMAIRSRNLMVSP